MHFERLLAGNLRGAGDREFDFTLGPGRVRRWNVFPSGAASTSLLHAMALMGLGWRQVQMLDPRPLARLPARRDRPARLEVVQIRHAPQERGDTSPARRHLGWAVDGEGRLRPLRTSEACHRDPTARPARPESGRSHVGRLVLGYGSRVQPHAGTDCFDILPDQRLKRCAGLFELEAPLTDPLAFLRRLCHKSQYRDGRARALLVRLSADLGTWLGRDATDGPGRNGPFEVHWPTASTPDRALLTVYLDIARHAFDTAMRLRDPDPLRQPGVVLLDRPERWCDIRRLPRWFELLDARFPQLQFFVALSPRSRRLFPTRLLDGGLDLPEPARRRRRAAPRPLPRGTVLLVDVDGTLPNLALMKLSRQLKDEGRPVALVRGVDSLPRADTVLASCVFSTAGSAARLQVLRKTYGDALRAGGSGVDLRLRLPPDVESLAPDYALYPELGDRAMGFLTRGCPRRCPFCVVPVKEGRPRQVGDLDTILQGRRKLILLDDNLLAHPTAPGLLAEMARRELAVNFNQTLDLRHLTPESAGLLRRIRCSNVGFTRCNYHFSLNDARGLDQVRQRYGLLHLNGRDNAEFVCMYGFNTSLAEDVERFRFLRSLPGAYVFVQRYRPVPGGPAPELSRLFDERADTLLDELVRIVFPQNMKSMETYYRWLALQYAAQCGRIHRPLVETLFRYNCRPRMGSFLHELEALTAQGARFGEPAGAPRELGGSFELESRPGAATRIARPRPRSSRASPPSRTCETCAAS